MARPRNRRRLIWHIGLPHAPRAVLPATLAAHADELAASGTPVVATPEQADLATHELLRLSPNEGQWARIADRVWSHKGVSLLSTPDLGSADKDQIRLALDPLIGVEVHLVVAADSFAEQVYGAWLAQLRAGRSTGWEKYAERVLERAADGTPGHRQAEEYWAGHELASVLARWGWTIHADRIHVSLGGGPAAQWEDFRRIAAAADLSVVVPPLADPAGAAVLRRVNRQLDGERVAGSAELLTRATDADWGMPAVDVTVLRPLAERWAETLGAGGYDVRGEVLDLLGDHGAEATLPGHRDQLAAAVDALSDALADNARLRAQAEDLQRENARLDKKRRKHKRRLRELTASS